MKKFTPAEIAELKALGGDVLLGKGSSGEVFLGAKFNETYDGGYRVRNFAVKKLSPDIVSNSTLVSKNTLVKKSIDQLEKDVEREIILLSKVKHLNIIKLYGYCSENLSRSIPVIHLVYEHGSCGDLYSFIMQNKTAQLLTWSIRQKIIYQVFCAVEFLHSNGYIHHDIKSRNIVLTAGLIPKLIDFGMTIKALKSKETERGATFQLGSIGKRFGTQGYICPNYNAGTVPQFDTFCEMFSLGVVCAELYTGVLQLSDNNNFKDADNPPDNTMPVKETNIWGDDDDVDDEENESSEQDMDISKITLATLVRRVELNRDFANYSADPRICANTDISNHIKFIAGNLMSDYPIRVQNKCTAGRILEYLRKQMDPDLPKKSQLTGSTLLCTNCHLRFPDDPENAKGICCPVGHFLCKFCFTLTVDSQQRSPEGLLFNEVFHDSQEAYFCPYCAVFNDVYTNSFHQTEVEKLVGRKKEGIINPCLPSLQEVAGEEENADGFIVGSQLFMDTMNSWGQCVQDVVNATICAHAIYEPQPLYCLNFIAAKMPSQHPWKLWLHQTRKDEDHCCFGVLQQLGKSKLFISFRGSEDVKDGHANIQFIAAPAKIVPGKVHIGFWKKACKFYETYHEYIFHLIKVLGIKHVVFCGHSLGGAIAKLVSVKFHFEWQQRNSQNFHASATFSLSCIAIGPPLVGDTEFAKYVNDQQSALFRILSLVNEDDFVPRLLANSLVSYYPFGRYVFVRPNGEPLAAFDIVSHKLIYAILAGLKATSWAEGTNHHRMGGLFQWLGLYSPTPTELQEVLDCPEKQFNYLDMMTPKPLIATASLQQIEKVFSVDDGTLGVLPVSSQSDFVALSVVSLLACEEYPLNPVDYINAFAHANNLLCRFTLAGQYHGDATKVGFERGSVQANSFSTTSNTIQSSVLVHVPSSSSDWKLTAFHPVGQENTLVLTIHHEEHLLKQFIGAYSCWVTLGDEYGQGAGARVNALVWSVAQELTAVVTEQLLSQRTTVDTLVLTGFSVSGSIAQVVGYLLAVDSASSTAIKVLSDNGPFVTDQRFEAHTLTIPNLFYHSFYFNGLVQPSFFSFHYLYAGVYCPLIGKGSISFVFTNRTVFQMETTECTMEEKMLIYRLFHQAFLSQNLLLRSRSPSPPTAPSTDIAIHNISECILEWSNISFSNVFDKHLRLSASTLASLRTSSKEKKLLNSLSHMVFARAATLMMENGGGHANLPAYHPGCYEKCYVPGLAIPDQYADGMPHPLWHCCFRRRKVGCKQGFPRHHPGFYGLGDPTLPYSYQGFRDVLSDLSPEWSCCGEKDNWADGCQPGPHPKLLTTWIKRKFSTSAADDVKLNIMALNGGATSS